MELISAPEFPYKTYPIRWRIEAEKLLLLTPPLLCIYQVYAVAYSHLCLTLDRPRFLCGVIQIILPICTNGSNGIDVNLQGSLAKISNPKIYTPFGSLRGGGNRKPTFSVFSNENSPFNGFGRQFYAHNLIIRKFEPHINTVEERN